MVRVRARTGVPLRENGHALAPLDSDMIYCDPDSGSCFVYPSDDDTMAIDVGSQPVGAAYPEHGLTAENVPLRAGPPTREELLVHYPAKFTWEQLKTFVNSG
jgi:hypothetical protein